MEITSSPQPSALASPSPPDAARGSAAISSDFETFIKMLTVQMQNQDPLNPVDSADFAVQLATFSTVEQQVLTNTLLTTLGDHLGALSVTQLSGWIGMEARAEMPVEFTGAPVNLTLNPESLADQVQLVVRNSQGTEVQRLNVSTQGGEYEWPGLDSFGNPLISGTYEITVESFASGEPIGSSPTEVHALVVEARNDNGQPTLVMEGGQQVGADRILGLRQPST